LNLNFGFQNQKLQPKFQKQFYFSLAAQVQFARFLLAAQSSFVFPFLCFSFTPTEIISGPFGLCSPPAVHSVIAFLLRKLPPPPLFPFWKTAMPHRLPSDNQRT
jgi:hypothetical protein